jgi:putative hydrolase of the HAD superfamily
MIKAILFDCFGVLRPEVLHAAYQKFGGDIDADRDFIRDTLYASHTGRIGSSAPVFAKHLGISLEKWSKAIVECGNDQDVLNYVVELRASYKTGVLSNVGKSGLLRYFSAEELEKLFDAQIISGEIGFAKPEAEAYEIAAERLGVRTDECVFIDDKAEFCEAARGVGMKAIHYKNFAQFKAELEQLLNQSAA